MREMRRRAIGWWLVLAGVLCLFLIACAPSTAPKDVAFVIPSGTESALERGEAAFRFPEEIDLTDEGTPLGGVELCHAVTFGSGQPGG